MDAGTAVGRFLLRCFQKKFCWVSGISCETSTLMQNGIQAGIVITGFPMYIHVMCLANIVYGNRKHFKFILKT